MGHRTLKPRRVANLNATPWMRRGSQSRRVALDLQRLHIRGSQWMACSARMVTQGEGMQQKRENTVIRCCSTFACCLSF